MLIARSLFSYRRGNTSMFISLLGVSIGVFSLIAIVGMMNGIQGILVDKLINIESYNYVGTQEFSDMETYIDTTEELESNKAVDIVVPFIDEFAFIESEYASSILHVRAVHSEQANKDTQFLEELSLASKKGNQASIKYFASSVQNDAETNMLPSIIIGWSLSGMLDVDIGDEVLLSFPGGGNGFIPIQTNAIIKEIFYSNGSYDNSWGFMSLEDYLSINEQNNTLSYGIRAVEKSSTQNIITSILDTASSWQDNNSAFYIALKTEKIILVLLCAVIFFIIILHFRFSMLRRIRNKKDDIVALRTLGMMPIQIQQWFLGETIIIGLIGTIIGSGLGLVFVYKYQELYLWVFDNFSININMAGLVNGYVSNGEFVSILCFIWVSLLLASIMIVRKSVKISPLQVLKYE